MMRNLTSDQEDVVIEHLCEGFGIEDVVVIEGYPAGPVRQFVRSLSRDLINEIYPRKGQA